MADQRPLNSTNAPDPATSYERARPENESGQGRLDNNTDATPADSPDRQDQAVSNAQPPRQINAQETTDERAEVRPPITPAPKQPDHSMNEEPPLGEDQMPTDIHDPRHRRHPRTEGKGGTP